MSSRPCPHLVTNRSQRGALRPAGSKRIQGNPTFRASAASPDEPARASSGIGLHTPTRLLSASQAATSRRRIHRYAWVDGLYAPLAIAVPEKITTYSWSGDVGIELHGCARISKCLALSSISSTKSVTALL